MSPELPVLPGIFAANRAMVLVDTSTDFSEGISGKD